MKRIVDWLDERTGCRGIVRAALFENVPGGARWRYIWGSTLVLTLAIQFITGIFLWMAYNPSAQTAWESVYYIQYEMTGGWFLRGLHHYTAQVMVVLLVLHLMQVVIDGAYKAPREVNFWFGLVLLLLVMALSLTGYLLPWDQKGYWATKVATNLVALIPVVGPDLQWLLIGGADYGHHTLSRFFALHAGVLPAAVILLLVGHIYLFRRHGITAKKPLKKPDAPFWPDQLLRDAVTCLAVLATILFFVIRHGGADLGPPADPSEPFAAARPDWYFVFLFQFLKYFPGSSQVWGAIIIPSLVLLVMFAIPFLGKWKLGHRFNLFFLWSIIFGAGLLTYLALAEDRRKPQYIASVEEVGRDAARVKDLARSPEGIPAAGAVTLLQNDPFTQGPRLFAQHCASCHRFDGHDGRGRKPEDPPSAPDLAGFASRDWLRGLMDPEQISELHYFGGTRFANGQMARFVRRDVAGLSPEERADLERVMLALSAEAQLPYQAEEDERDAEAIRLGRKLIDSFEMRCTECHTYYFEDRTSGPDLSGYGSREWMIEFIANPEHERFYGNRNDRMPAFRDQDILSEHEIGLVVDWLRRDWYEPAPPSTAAHGR